MSEISIPLDVTDVVEGIQISEECSSDPVDSNASSTSTGTKTSIRTKIDQYYEEHYVTPKNNIIWRKHSTYITPPIQWYEQKNLKLLLFQLPQSILNNILRIIYLVLWQK